MSIQETTNRDENSMALTSTTQKPNDCTFQAQLQSLIGLAITHPEIEEVLQAIMDEALRVVAGKRGFLAVVNYDTGEVVIKSTAGSGWTERTKKLRLHLAQETNRGITGHVALSGKPYMTGDASNDPYFLSFFPDVKSEIAVPVIEAEGNTRGVINIDSSEADAFDAGDIVRLESVADVAAFALIVNDFRTRERALIEIGNELSSIIDLESLVRKVVDVSAEVLRYEDCSVYLLDEQTDLLVLQASRGPLKESIGQATYELGQGITGWVAQHGEPVRILDVASDPRWRGVHLEIPREEMGALLCVPIISRDKVVGVIRVVRRRTQSSWFQNNFTEMDERVLTTIASQLGAAVENVRGFHRLLRAERMAAWGELSAKSAHMIGNRTFALKGDLNELRYILNQPSWTEQHDDLISLLESMEHGVTRLEEILHEFRDFVVATKVTLQDADINEIIQEVIAESFPKRSEIKLILQLAKDLPVVKCDETRLKRAFSELIENSVSFQPHGGELLIRSRLTDQSEQSRYRLAPSRQYVQVEFIDQGPGIPPDTKSRIFQPFFSSRVKGMGLGLSIVKGIVEAHHGIIIESGEPGKGAWFSIFLPTQRNESSAIKNGRS